MVWGNKVSRSDYEYMENVRNCILDYGLLEALLKAEGGWLWFWRAVGFVWHSSCHVIVREFKLTLGGHTEYYFGGYLV